MVIETPEKLPWTTPPFGSLRVRTYWSEEGIERHALLKTIFELLDKEGWNYSADTGWKRWDIQIYGNFFWSILLQSVTEYHGGPKCLTRVRLAYRFVSTTVIINLLGLSLLLYRQLNNPLPALWLIVPYIIFLIFLVIRARRLKRRVAELVDVAAHRAGLQRIARRTRRAIRRAEAAARLAKVDSVNA